jgi:hypothetical protein
MKVTGVTPNFLQDGGREMKRGFNFYPVVRWVLFTERAVFGTGNYMRMKKDGHYVARG